MPNKPIVPIWKLPVVIENHQISSLVNAAGCVLYGRASDFSDMHSFPASLLQCHSSNSLPIGRERGLERGTLKEWAQSWHYLYQASAGGFTHMARRDGTRPSVLMFVRMSVHVRKLASVPCANSWNRLCARLLACLHVFTTCAWERDMARETQFSRAG